MKNQIEKYKEAASILPGSVLGFQLEDDDSMKVLFYSQRAQEITGMNRSEVDQTIHADGFNMIVEADQKIILEKVKEAIARKTEVDVVYRQHHKAQGIVWIHMKAAISGEMDGKPVFIATMLDVTAEMLNSSSIMEASDHCICVIEKHTKLMLYANTKFYELIDSKPSESMGVYCYDVLCGNPAFKTNDQCLCFATINIEKPFEYYNPETKKYISMYGREIMWGEHEAYVFFLSDQTKEKFNEIQLKNAQERVEVTLENSNLFVWEYDIINSQCINSEKAVRDYGIPRVIDNYPESLYEMGHTPPETVEQIKEVKRRLLNGETGFSVERRTVDINGDSQWMKVSYTLETDAHGRPARALVCGTDITELKRKQIEYEEELRLKKTVTSDTTILCVLNLTKDRIVENDAQSPVLEKYLAGRTTIDSVMNAVCDNLVVVSDREEYRRHFSRAHMLADYDRGILHGSFCHQFSHRVGWFESAYDLIQNPTSGDVEAITSIKDVTDEARSRQVVNKLTSIDYDSIMTIDVETEALYLYNRGRMSGAGTGEQVDAKEFKRQLRENATRCCTPEEAKRIIDGADIKLVTERLKTTPMYTLTCTMTIDGKTTCKRNIYSYLDDSHKTILCATQDVTESYLQEEKQRKELSEALQKAEVANHAKTMFLSRVSHDMRTPLNGVLGLTALMKDEAVNPEVLDDLKSLELSGKYLLDLINDVLDVSSIETGNLKLKPAVCDVRQILNNIVKLVKPNMDAKNIDFVLDTDELVLGPTFVDEARLQQVAINVLGNAAKFTPEGGRVEFICKTLSTADGVIVNDYIIKDNGIGMDADFVPHLFEPFAQENATITNSKNGTGLGMSITKNLVELMNGTIDVESQKGVGTTVHIMLKIPLATAEQIKESKESVKPKATNFNLEGRRVLLCEDHPLNRQIATRLLEKVGVVVECAENGEVGVTMFQNSDIGYYDAILMDIRMPVMDGLEASRIIRRLARPDATTIPILAMTANALDEDVKNAVAAGMNAHISKPVDALRLYQNLNKFINAKRVIAKTKILVVDDIEVNRTVVVETLRPNYEVLEAQNGAQALEILGKVRGVALILTDLEMPEMDGRELIRRIRSSTENRHIAIMAYTQHNLDNQEELLLQLGANDFIYKPLNPTVVKLRVKNLLNATS